MTRKRFQFSLRTAIVMSVVAGVLIWAGMKYYRWRTYCTITVVNESGEVLSVAHWIEDSKPTPTFKKLPRTEVSTGQVMSIEIERRPVRNVDIIYSSAQMEQARDFLVLNVRGDACKVTVKPNMNYQVDPADNVWTPDDWP